MVPYLPALWYRIYQPYGTVFTSPMVPYLPALWYPYIYHFTIGLVVSYHCLTRYQVLLLIRVDTHYQDRHQKHSSSVCLMFVHYGKYLTALVRLLYNTTAWFSLGSSWQTCDSL